jgi:uncharacterized protein (TIGR02145 family)
MIMQQTDRPNTQKHNCLWTGFTLAALACLVLAHTTLAQDVSGQLDPGADPADAHSQMYTLEDIYNRLNTGAAGQKQTSFTEPAAGPADNQGRSTDDIMNKAPAVDDDLGARPEDVKAGKIFWGLRSDSWGLLTGTGESGSETTCGAYVAPGVWKEFDCYNLAAAGKVTGVDPFTPSWQLNGGYWQWGRKGPDPGQWYNTNTANFAHGPNGPRDGEANSGEITGWDQTDAPDGAWSDSHKTANDPCPEGFRVPTKAHWDGVLNNNIQSTVGLWENSAVNYSSARFFGEDLMLPAAGFRNGTSGALFGRGDGGYYWCNSEYNSLSAWYLNFFSGNAHTTSGYRRDGFSIRCIEDSDPPVPCTYTLSSTSGTSISDGGDLSVTVTASRSDCAWTTDNSLSWVSLSPESGTGSGDVTLSITTNTGAARTCSITIAGQAYSISQDAAIAGITCGAYIADGVWKEFDCYNLAAIGKTTNDDPFSPSWRLIGGYWQWGRKGPDPVDWYNTNTSNFAHGPTGPESGEANSSSISGWSTSDAPNGAWSDNEKTTNDPCPAGYRVPTNSQWEGVLGNNTQSVVGSWTTSTTNYSTAIIFGDVLMLPAAGAREINGSLNHRGSIAYYWSSSGSSMYSLGLDINSDSATTRDHGRRYGLSVRCVPE